MFFFPWIEILPEQKHSCSNCGERQGQTANETRLHFTARSILQTKQIISTVPVCKFERRQKIILKFGHHGFSSVRIVKCMYIDKCHMKTKEVLIDL